MYILKLLKIRKKNPWAKSPATHNLGNFFLIAMLLYLLFDGRYILGE